MKQLTIFSLIAIWLYLFWGCGDEQTTIPTIVKDTTPPTIVATNVQGGPIPVNTPIVLVFSEKVNLTSAQRGVSVRSSIDAEPVKGVVTLQNSGREVKFTPIEHMTSGGYVLMAIGIEDTAGNVLLTPVSIFFGAVEVDTTKPAADVTPPTVVSTIPTDGQSMKGTDNLVVRFDEEVDVASAQAGIVVSDAEGIVDVTGAVAIFKPQKPMKVGEHTLTIIGVKDLSGNTLDSSVIIPFKVIKPPPEVITPPTTGGRALRGGILFRAFTRDRPIPNASAENANEWNKRNVTPGKNVFQVAGGRLKQTSNGCSESTKTLFPVNGSNWTDYTVVVDFWDRDNDSISIIFRYTDPDNYYNFT
ncbi:MAG: Ig-like domain-containing protein, partial [Candidatus Poribacteria bacterium]